MKKILFSNYDDLKNPYYGGGGAFAIHDIAKRLAKKHTVSVLTSRYHKSKNLILDNVKYERIGSAINPKFDQIIYNLVLPFYVLTHDFDIWFESFTPPTSTSLLPLWTKKPVVGITQFFNAEEKSKQYKLPFYLVQNFEIKFYKYLIVLSQETKNKISKLNPRANVIILPNGIKTPKASGIKKGNYILYLGRIEIHQKGLDLLLTAYSKIIKKTKLNLYIAGNGNKSDFTKITKKITELHLERRVKLLGRIEGSKKDKIIKESNFMVIPSRFETQGIVALEAFSFGKPIIIFDIPGFKWIPYELSIKIPSFSVEKLSEAILNLSTNTNLYQKISKNTRSYAKKFDWAKVTKQYDTLIKNLT